MQKFAKLIPDEANLPTVLADLSWSHIRCILDGTKSIEESLWYDNGKNKIMLFESVTNCNQLKIPATDGKMYLTPVEDWQC